jgi:hypothetical protein
MRRSSQLRRDLGVDQLLLAGPTFWVTQQLNPLLLPFAKRSPGGRPNALTGGGLRRGSLVKIALPQEGLSVAAHALEEFGDRAR